MLRNVLLHGDKTTIVDFSNSQLKHIYPGSTCWERLEAKQALGIEATLAQEEGVRYHSWTPDSGAPSTKPPKHRITRSTGGLRSARK
jgi:hypothetical protein